MINLHNNFKDLFRATRLGLSIKKLFVMMCALLVGFIFYFILTYIGFVLANNALKDIWSAYKFFPVPVIGVTVLPWYSWVLWYLGIFLYFLSFIFGQTAIGKITFEQLKGNEFYEMKEATKFAFKYFKSAIFAPLTLLILIAIMFLGAFIFGLIGRIPYFGPLFIILFIIPIIFGALFTIYLIIVSIVSLFVSPIITSSSKSDTFDTLFETFSLVWDQPWRLVVWSSLIFVMSSFGFYIFSYIIKYTLELTRWALAMWNGGSWLQIWQNGFYFLPPVPAYSGIEKLANYISPFLFNEQVFVAGNWAINLASLLMGIVLYIIGFTVIAYFFTSWTAGLTLLYVNLVKIKDDVNLLEEQEEDFDEIEEDIEEDEEHNENEENDNKEENKE